MDGGSAVALADGFRPQPTRKRGSVYEEPPYEGLDLEMQVVVVRLIELRRQRGVEDSLCVRRTHDVLQVPAGPIFECACALPTRLLADRARPVLPHAEPLARALSQGADVDGKAAGVARAAGGRERRRRARASGAARRGVSARTVNREMH